MKSACAFGWLVLGALIRISVQQCTMERLEGANDLNLLFEQLATEAGETFSVESYTIFYNCLSTTQTIGLYSTMSVSVWYTRSDDNTAVRQIRYNLVCTNDLSGSFWSRVDDSATALNGTETRRDCSSCLNTTVNDDHCTTCDASCTGLNQCYGSMASQCCDYNDNGTCTTDCGMNREGNTTFHCVCSNFWSGVNCDVCGLACSNGGTPNADCSSCDCVLGYEGMLCDVDIDDCDPDPCVNGACTDAVNDYSCACQAGYTGKSCDDCVVSNCLTCNNIQCIQCQQGYQAADNDSCTVERQNDDKDLIGLMIGIVVGCFVGILLLIIIFNAAVLVIKKQKNNSSKYQKDHLVEDAEHPAEESSDAMPNPAYSKEDALPPPAEAHDEDNL